MIENINSIKSILMIGNVVLSGSELNGYNYGKR